MRKLLCAILALITISGCRTSYLDSEDRISSFNEKFEYNTYIFPDAAKVDYSLYCADGVKAKFAYSERIILKYENGKRFYWEVPDQYSNSSKYAPYHICEKCRPYINNNSEKKITYDDYKVIYESKINKIEPITNTIRQECLQAAFEQGYISAVSINKKYYIICLEPLVVIALEIDNVAWNKCFSYRLGNYQEVLYLRKRDGYFYRYDPFDVYKGRVVETNNTPFVAGGIVLPDGLDFGLKLPFIENPQWFSPDMKIKEQPIEMVSEGEGRIVVPWGCLYITRNDNKWMVTAEKNRL